MELIIRNEIEQLDKIEEFIEQLAKRRNLDSSLAFNLNLALEEAVSNIIFYAFAPNASEEISIILNESNISLQFIICDGGKEFDPTKASEVDVSLTAERRRVGGLGIFLVRKIMDEVKYERIDEKNILTLKKNL